MNKSRLTLLKLFLTTCLFAIPLTKAMDPKKVNTKKRLSNIQISPAAKRTKNNDQLSTIINLDHANPENTQLFAQINARMEQSNSSSENNSFLAPSEIVSENTKAALVNCALYGNQIRRALNLINKLTFVNTAGADNLYPIHVAARMGNYQVLPLLIAKGADVNASSYLGSPLECAIHNYNVETARILLNSGAKPEPITLIDEKINILPLTIEKLNALLYIRCMLILKQLDYALQRNDAAQINQLTKQQIPLPDSIAPLHVASTLTLSKQYLHAIVKNYSYCINSHTQNISTPLILAIVNNNIDFAAALIDLGADINKRVNRITAKELAHKLNRATILSLMEVREINEECKAAEILKTLNKK